MTGDHNPEMKNGRVAKLGHMHGMSCKTLSIIGKNF